MRPFSAAVALSVALGAFVLAEGCSAGTKPAGFFASGTRADGGAGGNEGEGGLGLFSDDASDTSSVLAPDAACATATAATERDPAYLLFIVDGSASMEGDDKWTSQTAALDAIFDEMFQEADKALGVGLIVFSDKLDKTGGEGPYPTKADIPIGFVDQTQHDALRARIDPSAAKEGTPTYAALSGGYKEMEAFTAAAPLLPNGNKVVVLLTDGQPDNGTEEQNQCTSAAAKELALATPQGPIKTFAVGVGPFPAGPDDGYDPAFLGRLAQSGGTAPAGCDPASTDLAKICHFQVTPNGATDPITQAFIDAIDKIRGELATCDFTLNFQGTETVDPSHVNVVYTDGSGQHIIPQDPNAGWTYDDPTRPTKVTLHGSACDAMKTDPDAQISIMIGCKTLTN